MNQDDPRAPEAPPTLTRARSLWSAGQHQEAEALFERLAAGQDGDQAAQAFAEHLAQAGRRGDAERWLRTAHEKAPTDGEHLLRLVRLLNDSGQHAEALPLAHKLVALDPLKGAYRNRLGLAYLQLRKPIEAEGHFRSALALEPAQRVEGNLVHALLEQNRVAEAYALTSAWPPPQEDAFLARTLACVHDARGAWAEAEPLYRAQARLLPKHPPAKRELAKNLLAQGRRDEAQDLLEQLSPSEPLKPWVTTRAGYVMAEFSNRPYYEALLRDEAKAEARPDSAMQLGLFLWQTGARAEADTWLRRARELLPNAWQTASALGIFLEATGRGMEARPLLEQALQERPQDGGLRLLLAHIDSGLGRQAETEAHLRTLLLTLTSPGADRSACLGRLGLCLMEQQAYAEAEAYAAEALNGWGNAPSLRLYLGLARLKQGKVEAGRPLLQQALAESDVASLSSWADLIERILGDDAEPWLRQAIARVTDGSSAVALQLAAWLLARDRVAEALLLCNHLLGNFPKYVPAMAMRTVCTLDVKQATVAKEALRAAVRKDAEQAHRLYMLVAQRLCSQPAQAQRLKLLLQVLNEPVRSALGYLPKRAAEPLDADSNYLQGLHLVHTHRPAEAAAHLAHAAQGGRYAAAAQALLQSLLPPPEARA